MLYSFYLDNSNNGNYYPDYITYVVAEQSSSLIDFFGYESKIEAHETDPSQKLYVNGHYMVRIVEGCNAISVIILFFSFIISFAEGFKKTLGFLFLGALLLYLVNLLRIAILSIVYYLYPEYQETLHNIVFPAFIYGMVLLLWMIWVKLVSKKED